MLKEYSISEILSKPEKEIIPYYIGTFEGTEDPDIEWPHRHAFYSLVWFTDGSGFYVVDFDEYEIKPQRIFLVNSKQIHNWDYSENSKGYLLMIDNALSLELNIDCPFNYIDISESHVTTFKSIFDNLIEESSIEDYLSANNIKTGFNYIYSLVRRIAEPKQQNTSTANQLLERLKLLIFDKEKNISTAEDYAHKLQTSVEELNSVCKGYTGVSIKQYILDLKLTEAKRLLLFSTLNVNEIAFQLHIEDSSYFSRIFKKKVGMSPTDFIRKYRKHL